MTDTPDATAPDGASRSGLRRAVSVVGLVGSVAAIVWLVWRRPEDFAVVADLGLVATAAIVALQVAQLLITAQTHRFVLQQVTGRRIEPGPWAEMFVVARFLNTFVPQGGNAYRATRLRLDHDVTLTGYVAAFLTFMWLLTEFNLVAAALAAAVDADPLRLAGLDAAPTLAAAATLLAVGPVLATAVWRRLPTRNDRLGWLLRRIDEMLRTATGAFTTASAVRRGLVHATLTSGIATAVVWTAFLALGIRLGLAEVLVFYAITQIGTFVPITPGNVGVQELAFGAVATAAGLDLSDGIVVSALLRVTGLVSLVLVAVPLGGVRVWRTGPAQVGPTRRKK